MTPASDQDIPRKVAASQGFHWVATGFRLYRKTPLLLSAAFAMLFGVVMALGLIPVVGASLSELALPLMVAGFMAAYRALDDGNELELPHFLAGVQGPAVPLMTVGAVQLLGTLLIGQVMLGMGFDPEKLVGAIKPDPSPQDMQVMSDQLPAMLTGVALLVPLLIATLWVTPALILFGNAKPIQALLLSLRAALKNWSAILVYALVLWLLLSVAMQMMRLGVLGLLGILMAMPVLLGSLYASYQAIFAVWADESAPDNVVPR
jgi:hypothetical protein